MSGREAAEQAERIERYRRQLPPLSGILDSPSCLDWRIVSSHADVNGTWGGRRAWIVHYEKIESEEGRPHNWWEPRFTSVIKAPKSRLCRLIVNLCERIIELVTYTENEVSYGQQAMVIYVAIGHYYDVGLWPHDEGPSKFERATELLRDLHEG